MSGSTIGGVDASIPLQAGRGVPQFNPLQQIGEFANTANSLNQLKMFPGQQQLQQGQIQLQQQGIQAGATSLAKLVNQAGYEALAPILATPDGSITHDAITTQLASIEHGLHIPTSGILQDILATAPSGDGPEFDAKVRALVASRSQTDSANAVGMVTKSAGTPYYDANGHLQPTVVAPRGSPQSGVTSPAGAPLVAGLSPLEGSTPTPIGVVPTGQPNAGAQITAPLRNTPFAPGASSFPNGGRNAVPPELLNPNATLAATPTAATPTQGGVVTTLGPSATAAAAQTGAQSATAFQKIADEGVQAKSQAAILDTMLGDTSQFATGPGASGIKDFKAVLQRVSPTVAGAFGVTPESLAANESFDKFANQLANAQGAGSDARLAVNQGANPSSHLTPAGVDLIIRQLRGNSDYLAARSQLASQWPNKEDRPGFETQIATNLDPRVFQIARMKPEQQTTFYNSIGQGLPSAQAAQQKAAFQQSYHWAEQHGLLPTVAQNGLIPNAGQ